MSAAVLASWSEKEFLEIWKLKHEFVRKIFLIFYGFSLKFWKTWQVIVRHQAITATNNNQYWYFMVSPYHNKLLDKCLLFGWGQTVALVSSGSILVQADGVTTSDPFYKVLVIQIMKKTHESINSARS